MKRAALTFLPLIIFSPLQGVCMCGHNHKPVVRPSAGMRPSAMVPPLVLLPSEPQTYPNIVPLDQGEATLPVETERPQASAPQDDPPCTEHHEAHNGKGALISALVTSLVVGSASWQYIRRLKIQQLVEHLTRVEARLQGVERQFGITGSAASG